MGTSLSGLTVIFGVSTKRGLGVRILACLIGAVELVDVLDELAVQQVQRDVLEEMYGEAGKTAKRAEAYMIVERRNMVARQKFQDLFKV